MIGVKDDQLDEALEIIRKSTPLSNDPERYLTTIYVLNVKNYKRV
jgi:hypothetical protein